MTASPQGGVTQIPVQSRPTPARGQFLRARATLGRGRNEQLKVPTTGGAVEGYRIDVSTNGQAWMPLQMSAPANMTTYSDKGIMDGTARVYRVFAFNSSGTGPVSEAEAGSTSASSTPGPVTGLRAAPASGTAGRNAIVLTWNAPTNTGGSPIQGYHVYYAIGTATGGSNPFVDRGDTASGPALGDTVQIIATGDTKNTYTHMRLKAADTPRLSAATTYLYRVYAVNEDGNVSLTSDTRSATTGKIGNPSEPTDLTAVLNANDGVSLYWSHPADNGGRSIASFRVERRIVAPTAARTDWPAATATSSDDGVDDVPVPADLTTEATTTVNTTISTLTVANTYEFRVYAENRAPTDSDFSSSTDRSKKHSNVVRVQPVADAAAFTALNLPAAPTTVTASRDPKGVVTLKWTRSADALSYRIDVSKNSHYWEVLKSSTGFTSGQYTYTDPEPGSGGLGVTRYYRVFERNRNGLGLASELVTSELTPAEDPGQVRDLTVTPDATDPTKISASWKAPVDSGKAFVTGYCIDYVITTATPAQEMRAQPSDTARCANAKPGDVGGTEMGGRVKIEAPSNPATSYTLEKLSAKSRVEFRVVAQTTDIGGVRRYSDVLAADVISGTTVAVARPNPPSDLTAESARDSNLEGTGNLGVNLLWNAPSGPDGITIDGYRVQVSTDGGTTYTDVEDDTGTVTIGTAAVARTYFTHESEPAADEVRMYRVAALDDEAMTEQSAWSNVVEYPAQMHTHNAAPERVGMIADMTATEGDADSTMDVMGYFRDADTGDTLTYSAMSGDMSVATAMIAEGTSMLTVTIAGEGTATITVTASDGTDSVDQTFMVTVAAAPAELMKPTNIQANPQGSGLVSVSWRTVDGASGYTIIAINVDDVDDYETKVLDDETETSTQIPLDAGKTYNIYVGSFAGQMFALNTDEKVRVIVE